MFSNFQLVSNGLDLIQLLGVQNQSTVLGDRSIFTVMFFSIAFCFVSFILRIFIIEIKETCSCIGSFSSSGLSLSEGSLLNLLESSEFLQLSGKKDFKTKISERLILLSGLVLRQAL